MLDWRRAATAIDVVDACEGHRWAGRVGARIARGLCGLFDLGAQRVKNWGWARANPALTLQALHATIMVALNGTG